MSPCPSIDVWLDTNWSTRLRPVDTVVPVHNLKHLSGISIWLSARRRAASDQLPAAHRAGNGKPATRPYDTARSSVICHPRSEKQAAPGIQISRHFFRRISCDDDVATTNLQVIRFHSPYSIKFCFHLFRTLRMTIDTPVLQLSLK